MKAKKLPSGSYRVQVVAGYDVKGKRVVKSFTADTEWKALKMAQEFKDGVDSDKDGNLTLRRATEIYIDSRRNLIEETTISNTPQQIPTHYGHQDQRSKGNPSSASGQFGRAEA